MKKGDVFLVSHDEERSWEEYRVSDPFFGDTMVGRVGRRGTFLALSVEKERLAKFEAGESVMAMIHTTPVFIKRKQ